MSLQMVEAYIPTKYVEKIEEKIKDFDVVNFWKMKQSEETIFLRMLVKLEDTEEVLNYLESVANLIDGFEIILLPVHTYLTRKTEEEIEKKQEKKKKDDEEEKNKILRASRQELFMSIEANSKIDWTFTIFVLLSAIVVTIGLIKNSSAIVIGGMVIAPLLGPVMGLAFAATIGDYKVVANAFASVLFGIGIALVISVIFGRLFHIPLNNDEILARTTVDLLDIVLALVSGAAGSLSIVRRMPSALVGVMVAVALLPPTVVLGISLGSLMWGLASGAAILLMVNISSILLSAVVVFSLVGIRPIKYEEIQRANNSKKMALVFISIIIAVLILAILKIDYHILKW